MRVALVETRKLLQPCLTGLAQVDKYGKTVAIYECLCRDFHTLKEEVTEPLTMPLISST